MSLLLKIKDFYFRNNFVTIFLFRAAIAFSAWFIFYRSGFFDVSFLDDFLIRNLIITSEVLLEAMGFDIFVIDKQIGISNSSGVLIGPPCNAFSLFVLYATFLLAFPGQWKRKAYFLPLGILIIHLLNLIRVIALILLAFYKPDLLEFNHSYTFTLVVYSFIFIMWMFWINLYTRKRATSKNI